MSEWKPPADAAPVDSGWVPPADAAPQEPSFPKAPPLEEPAVAGGGGALSTGSPTQPPAPVRKPRLAGALDVRELTGDISAPSDVTTVDVAPATIKPREMIESVATAPKTFSAPSPNEVGIDPRWEKVMMDFRAAGGTAPEGEMSIADEAEYKRDAILHQGGLIRDRRNALELAASLEEANGLTADKQRLHELALDLNALKGQYPGGLPPDVYEGAQAKLQEAQALQANIEQRLAPLQAEDAELEAASGYLNQKLNEATARSYQDPDILYRAARQSWSDERYKKAQERKAEIVANGKNVLAAYADPLVFEQEIAAPVYRTALRVGGNTGATLARTAGRFSPVGRLAPETMEDVAGWFSEGLKDIDARKPETLKKSILGDDWTVNEGWLPKLVEAGTNMAFLAGGGTAGAGGVIATGMLSSGDDYYQAGIEEGLTPNESMAFSMLMSGAESGVELVNPGPFFNSRVRGSLAKQALKSIGKGELASKATAATVSKYIASQGVMEGSEEVLTNLIQDRMKQATNALTGSDMDIDTSLKENAESFLVGAALGGIMGGGGVISQKPVYKEGVRWAIENEPEFLKYVSEKIPEADRKPIIEKFEKAKAVYRGIPPTVPKDKADTIAAAVLEKERIKEQQAKTVVDETVASAIGDTNADLIKEQDDIIADALGVDLVEIAKANETKRLQEQYDKAKLKSEITGTPMPEGMTRPKDVKIEVKETPTEEVGITKTANTEPRPKLFSEPNPETASIAESYRKRTGMAAGPGTNITAIDQDLAKKIADEYEAMPNNPDDPEVKAAYEALAAETKAQYDDIVKAGYTVELWDGEGEPYSGSADMIKDLRENKHMYVLPTSAAFGSEGAAQSKNPLLADSGYRDARGRPMLLNDVFRFVHDFFGHSERGNAFGPIGEENAWDAHARMYSPTARRAMTTETRGQNSWVNFGQHMRRPDGSIPKKGDLDFISPSERKFADQKVGLLPEWVSKTDDEGTIAVVPEPGALPTAIEGEAPAPEQVRDEGPPVAGGATGASAHAAPKDGGKSTPEPEVEKPEVPQSEKVEKRRMRAVAKRIREQYPELGKAMKDDGVYYDRLPHAVSRDEAKAVIDMVGLDEAARVVLNPHTDIPFATRVMLGRTVVKQLDQQGRHADAELQASALAELGTRLGQGVSAYRDATEDYSGEMLLEQSRRVVREKRKKQDEGVSEKTKKLSKGLRNINKEAAEEVVKVRKVRDKVQRAAEFQPTGAHEEAAYGSRNKIVTKQKYKEALRALQGKLGSGIPPELVTIAAYHIEAGSRTFAAIAERVIKDLGKKALPYLKGAYKEAAKAAGIEPSTDAEIDEFIWKKNTDKLIEQYDKAKKKGDVKEQKRAIAQLQDIAKEEGVWGEYRKYAADRLARLTAQQIQEDINEDPVLMEFTRGLVTNISAQLREEAEEKGKPEIEAKKQRRAIEIIGDAYKNPEKYEQAWNEARKEARRQNKDNEAALEKLDAYFGDFSPKPFSDATLKKSVREGLKDLDQKINDIIRKHWTIQDAAKKSLVDRLVKDAGLEPDEATDLAKAVSAEFDRIATEKKRALIQSIFSKKEAVAAKKKTKGVEDELVLLTNIGAFDDADIVKAYGDRMGFAQMTQEDASTLQGLAMRVESSPEGRPRLDAIEDLLHYQANLVGVSKRDLAQSIWYAHVLSGYETQEVNLIANTARLISEYAVAAVQKPGDAKHLAGAIFNAVPKALLEASATFRTGYSPIRGKVEVPAALERHSFEGLLSILNKHKYIRRAMVAADVVFFELNKEMRAYQEAVRMARGNPDPSMTIRQKALDIMGLNDETIRAAEEQAQKEYEDDVASAEGDKALLKKAERDRKRRVFELIERARPEHVKAEAADFGAQSTYNYKPQGLLGVAVNSVNSAIEKVPSLAYIVPFRNIIANVANDAINYTPWGFARAAAGGPVTGQFARKLSDDPEVRKSQLEQIRADLMAKAIIGTALTTLAFMLSGGDDGEEPDIEITAGGYGNYRQNMSLRESGWQPYSFKIKGTDKWISYQYTPLILAFGLVGHYRDAQKYDKEKPTDGFYTKFATAAGRNATTFFDLTFLTTLSNTLSTAVSDRNDEKFEDLLRTASRTSKSFVLPNLYTQASRQMQEIFSVPAKDVRGTLVGDLLRDIPVFRDSYQNSVNALGEEPPPNVGRFIETVRPDPVWNLMAEKAFPLSAPAPNSLVVYDPELGKERVFTEQERHDFYVLRGKYIREQLEADMPYFEGLSKTEFSQEMRTIQGDATYEAKAELALDEQKP